ncbi:shikimate 5-dehydrogenase [Mycobacterium bohemicum DSM 44277]|uniref:Shikimate 5-dehydrogenase n=1 Tax=Mycobacterium bohemicum DSM 44277 TaxID=1236609 RepID=A0A0U0WBD2_MYCBE|nr:shikimate 5-dehydrogenase [Mycobacterium bohemicum DSM 44277]
MLGRPIAHSRSPQLHLAAYRALGLTDWTYERIECGAEDLPRVVGSFGPEWVGVSVTMPGKLAALRFADERTDRAELVGSANTLVRTPAGWRADNTDIDGVVGASLREVDGAARQIIADAGYGENFGHGLGHGVGLQIHEAPGIGATSVGTLLAGSVVTVEPGVYLPGRGGVRIEDTLVVPGNTSTTAGKTPELLTRFPKELTTL